MNTNEKLQCVIDRVEGHQAVLRFPDKQELIVKYRYLPRNAKEGDVLSAEFLTEKLARAKKEDLAREMLNEILKTE